ncbi:MAG: hypothetical protein AAF739_05845 [Pseudomonadota bacterium]
MLTTISALALCVQVADYAAFHLSYHPAREEQSDRLYDQSDEWARQLSEMVSDDEVFIAALHDATRAANELSGDALNAELARCQQADTAQPSRKG